MGFKYLFFGCNLKINYPEIDKFIEDGRRKMMINSGANLLMRRERNRLNKFKVENQHNKILEVIENCEKATKESGK